MPDSLAGQLKAAKEGTSGVSSSKKKRVVQEDSDDESDTEGDVDTESETDTETDTDDES
jgi:translocation protein SEC63